MSEGKPTNETPNSNESIEVHRDASMVKIRKSLRDNSLYLLALSKKMQTNHNPSFTPRWLPKPQSSVEGCQATIHCQTSPGELGEINKSESVPFKLRILNSQFLPEVQKILVAWMADYACC